MVKNGDIIIDRYRIKDNLGEGGMAYVYLAFDMVSKRDVAIKMIREDTMKNPVNLSRFEREARAAASLNHQNVVRVINLGTYEGRPFMVNELIKGQTLKDVLKQRGKFTFLEASDVMYQLCSAVLHAHQHGVIHRDIKPENVFITEDGTITNENTGIPVMKGVPIMVQGVFATLGDMAKTFYHCGMDEEGHWSASKGWNAIKTDIWTNEIARRNIRRLFRDILIGGLLSPMAMLDYIGNQTNPATYRLYSKAMTDSVSLLTGKKTFGQVLVGSQAAVRTFQDTYNMWVRDTKSTQEA